VRSTITAALADVSASFAPSATKILRDAKPNADAKLGKEATLRYVTRMARDLRDYEQDPLALEKVRRELGDALEKAAAAAN